MKGRQKEREKGSEEDVVEGEKEGREAVDEVADAATCAIAVRVYARRVCFEEFCRGEFWNFDKTGLTEFASQKEKSLNAFNRD